MYRFEFTEEPGSYFLKLKGKVVKVYSKSRFSKQEAEDRASKEVEKAIKKYGIGRVEYDGCICY